ncbi:hypothetical protein SPSIL_057920 [Sporomusa silvacetica DSM 10669]|uniref:DNA integrity scanning protein DisA n=1 Tax=Sporomusa silvacetica DSM 10669 TaxID=1123289 RepID=A0ABZ3IVU4_9FIRM|nr:helix-hairpin-helix domain-containing protein [Sporomusa silvacetica]OZC14260.1 DNA integrity scanning protein DisA [Sporomusa silvacetica DSM 10669]
MSGTDSLKTILADCLRETSNGYTVDALLKEFPTMQELMNATEEEMMLVKGIGTVKAKQLSAILRFVHCVQCNQEG